MVLTLRRETPEKDCREVDITAREGSNCKGKGGQ